MLSDADIVTLPIRSDENSFGNYVFELGRKKSARKNNDNVRKLLTHRINEKGLLKRMLNPVKPSKFFKSYWQDQYLFHSSKKNRSFFTGLHSIKKLKRDLRTHRYQVSDVRLVQNQQYVALGEEKSLLGTYGDEGFDSDEFIAIGGSVVVDDIHRYNKDLNRIWHEFVDLFRFPVTCTSYFTPPGLNTFPTHWDTDDVFVLQVEGIKHWEVYEPVIPDLLEHHKWAKYACDFGEPIFSGTLKPGDLLYIPRGFPHYVYTDKTRPSLHITVGVCIPTWHRCLTSAVERAMLECGQMSDFRQPSPLMLGSKGEKSLEKYFDQLKKELMKQITLSSLYEANKDVLARQEAWGTMLETSYEKNYPVPDPDDRLLRSPGLCFVKKTRQGAVMEFGGRILLFPKKALHCLQTIAQSDSLRATDLPGKLSLTEHLVILRRLLNEGVLIPA